jgi:transcriptional regulator of acetoin/glycerol metabolism
VDQETIAGLDKALTKGEKLLEAGQAYRAEGELLVSIDGEQGTHHLLYVDGVLGDRRDLEAVQTYARVALRALRHPGTGGPRLSEDAKRNQLVSLLRFHEWNIARVARARNVTRKTIYEWLKKFKISRERVQKA